MDSPLPSPRLARKASSLPPALTPVLKTLGLEEDDPEEVFEIHSKEGAGAFGRVFRASYRKDPSRLAALKVIPVALEAGQRGEDIENVRREIQFLRECDHPNVVAFFGAYYKDHALWVAMEYCGGGSVGDVSRRRRLDEPEIAVITRGALQGLAYLHARKKIHRDIKGGNILLTSEGEVKIADFGVSAQLKDTMSRRGTFVGTPYWMSPEMIQESDYDYKSDIWSLGITIIELADQRPPLFDEHPMRVLIQIPRNPPPTVKQPLAWTPLLTQFLEFCLRKDPKERPSAVECLEHAFIQRVQQIPFVYADPTRRETVVEAAVVKVDAQPEPSKVDSTPRTIGSLTAHSSSDAEAMADDVTLKGPAARPAKALAPGRPSLAASTAGVPIHPSPDSEAISKATSARRTSMSLERAIISSDAMTKEDDTALSDADASLVTPRGSESMVDEVWDLSQSAAVTSSQSSRSDDDETSDGNDAAAEGFAFRQASAAEPASAAAPAAASPRAITTDSTKPPVEMVSGDELLRMSLDDSFEVPAMTLISKIQAAASSLADQSVRPRGTSPLVNSTTPLPIPLASAPSPIFKPSRKASLDMAIPSETTSQPRPIRRDLNSFSRTDSIGRGSFARVKAEPTSPRGDATEHNEWSNPLAQLTERSHDRVNALLSSLSASTGRMALLSPQHVESSMELNARASLRGSRPTPPPVPLSTMETTGSVHASSSNHFIGLPFRVSHQLNVKYNTLEAKFEGVPASTEWATVHRQFGIPLAQLRSRSNTDDHVPALVQMLRRELVRRDGLECKYIYRVSPDQSEVQHAKQSINSGVFDAASVTDPHVFASLIKIWLRELPTPLMAAIPRTDLAGFVESLVKPDDVDPSSSTVDAARELAFAMAFPEVHVLVTTKLLGKLSSAERGVLLWLVDHMLEVIAQSARNAMNAQSLAVVFAPNVYRWASTTPADASSISKQVATLLRALLAWRQRCRGGEWPTDPLTTTSSVGSAASRNLPVRSRPAKADATSGFVASIAAGSSSSLRDSISGLQSSLRAKMSITTAHDSTVSSILRRSSLAEMRTTSHFVNASRGSLSFEEPSQPSPTIPSTPSLETLLRECVDGLWNELPLSIVLDDPPPIVRSLHSKFQRHVLSLVAQSGRRQDEKQWANKLLVILEDKTKTSHLEKEMRLPLSLRVFKRWLFAALNIDAFTTLLRQERDVRDRLEKRWPKHPLDASKLDRTFNAERAFMMARILALAVEEAQRNNQSSQMADHSQEINAELRRVMLDGAACFVRVLHQSPAVQGRANSTLLPLAEELVTIGEQEPAMGFLLMAMSPQHTQRYHLEMHHKEVVAMVEAAIRMEHLV